MSRALQRPRTAHLQQPLFKVAKAALQINLHFDAFQAPTMPHACIYDTTSIFIDDMCVIATATACAAKYGTV